MVFWLKCLLNYERILISLILLESCILTGLAIILYLRFNFSGNLYMVIITISVCEAILGLRLIIYISRSKKLEFILLK